jgi:Flp pilus assembly protein TadD
VDGPMRLDFEDTGEPAPEHVPLYSFAPRMRTAVDWHEQGVGQERAGLLAEAVESYRRALLVGGPDAQICFDLAHVLAELGQREQAVERYRQVTELEQDWADAWNNLGTVLAELGDPAEAVQAFRQAVRLEPENAAARYNLANVLDEIGNEAEANDHFRMYLPLDPRDTPYGAYARQRLA